MPTTTAPTTAPAASAPADPGAVRAIAFPVVGTVNFIDTYGAPRSGARIHQGQDLMGVKGQVLVSVVDGTVTWIRHSSDGLSGNMLRITDADGWQYIYVHLNNDRPGTDDGANFYEQAFADGIRAGQRVRAGEPVGFIGDSGNAENAGAHLHFEILDPAGVAINPFASLRAAPATVLTDEQLGAAAPVGSLETATVLAPNTVRVTGWALDVVVDAPVMVSVYIDGSPQLTGVASASRPDVTAAHPGRTGDHGFDLTIAGVPSGARRVCVVVHNAGAGGGNRRLACADLIV